MLDVTALVQQMRDTLSEIHDTITSLDTKGNDEKLDALESQRDEVFRQLQTAFEKESAELSQRRQAERDEVAERRRKEDEEIAARRRREDEEKATKDHDQDAERAQKLESEKDGVELETDEKMDRIEEEAKRMLDEGHNKLKDLEDRRRVSFVSDPSRPKWWWLTLSASGNQPDDRRTNEGTPPASTSTEGQTRYQSLARRSPGSNGIESATGERSTPRSPTAGAGPNPRGRPVCFPGHRVGGRQGPRALTGGAKAGRTPARVK